jgi:hypothetical protein
MKGVKNNLLGHRYGWLKVIGHSAKRDSKGHAFWTVECACGKVKEVVGKSLKQGYTTSCGCKVPLASAKRRAGHYVPSFYEDD